MLPALVLAAALTDTLRADSITAVPTPTAAHATSDSLTPGTRPGIHSGRLSLG